MSDGIEIRTDQLSDEELKDLEGQGIDVSGPMVRVNPVKQSQPGTDEPAPVPPPKEKKPVAAPKPADDVVQRAKARIDAQQAMEGSSFEHRGSSGKLLEKQGEVKEVQEPDKEDPIEAHDKAAFLAYILGGERFKKTYTLFGGQLTVTFQTRTAAEDEKCAQQSFLDENLERGYAGTTGTVRDSQRLQRYFDYIFVASLAELKVAGQPGRTFKPFETKPRGDSIGETGLRQSRLDLMDEFPQSLKFALKNLHSRFENLVSRMTAQAESPDFWKAGSAT